MHRNLLLPITIFVFIITLASCSNADKTGLPVPKDAGFVLHINTPSLATKLTWQEIKSTSWFNEAYTDAPDSLAKKLLDNPESSGINTQLDLVFFTQRRGKGGIAVFEGTLKDAAAFEKFNKDLGKGSELKKEGDLSVLKNAKMDGITTWNGTRFAYIMDAPAFAMNDRASGGGSTNLTYDSLVVIAKELYALKSSNSLSEDKKYATLIKETGDIHMWMSAENLYGGTMSDMLSMMKAGVLLQGNITAATLNFDNGKMTINARSYYNDELAKVYDKYKLKNFDMELLNKVPSQNMMAAFAMNYPPEGLKEFMKVIGVDGFVNSFMGDIGYSVDEFVKANKGEVLITVSDFELKQQQVTMPGEDGGEGFTYTTTKPDMKVLFATSVNDKPAFDKMIEVIKGKVGEIPEGNGIPKITYTLNDKWFAAGNSPEQVNGFLAGTATAKHAFVSRLSGHPMGFYLDLNKIILATGSGAGSDSTSPSFKMVQESLKMWQDVIMVGGEIKDGAWVTSMEVNLVDKTTNSLKQLNQYIDRMNAAGKRGF